MAIDLTVGALAEAEPALARLADAKVPVATAFRLARITAAASAELKHFAELRAGLIREYGQPRTATAEERAAGTEETIYQVQPTSAHWPAFVERLTALMAEPLTLPVEPLDLASVPGLEMTATDVLRLGVLLKEHSNGSQ